MPNDSKSYVELNRRFRKLDQKAKTEDEAYRSYTTDFISGPTTLNWNDLLNESRAIILGEPGSGKSWELQERAKILAQQGKFAFFIRLDQMVEQSLSEILDANERSRLNLWHRSQDRGYFFLDSVDEAKFRKLSDFHVALKRFRNEIGNNLIVKANIFLSSRITEWKPLTDVFEFNRIFPVLPIEERVDNSQTNEVAQARSELVVVQLEPLDKTQVELFAGINNVSDVQAFLNAIDRAFAWEFARRPLDVIDLMGFWNKNGRIGSLNELIEFDVSSKLRPRQSRDEFSLSEADALDGVGWLAATSVFSRKFTFNVPDDGTTNQEALNPRESLPQNWNDHQIRALLNRAIFDSAVYGNFRFHHRRVGEYLAAKWIATRMERGCPQYVLEDLFTELVRGVKVLRPSLAPIAAWLCIGDKSWNRHFRDLVVQTEPGIHFNHGDPSSLSIDYKRQILCALARQTKAHNRMRLEGSLDSLKRIADPAISEDIAVLISDHQLRSDFRIAMLEIVRLGRLTTCLHSAIGLVSAPNDVDEVKSHAALAIGEIGDFKSCTNFVEVLSQLSSISLGVFKNAVLSLYPRMISSIQLVQFLKKTEMGRHADDFLIYNLSAHFESALEPANAGDLLRELVPLVQTPPRIFHGQKEIPVSVKFYWAARLIPTILKVLFRKPALDEDEAELAADCLRLLILIRDYRHYDIDNVSELNIASFPHINVRRNYVWKSVAAFRNEHKLEPKNSFPIGHHRDIFAISPQDFTWLVGDVCTRGENADRLLALYFAIEVWHDSGRGWKDRRHLRRAVSNNSDLRDAYRQAQMTGWLFPVKIFWWRNFHHKYGRWWWNEKLHKLEGLWAWYHGQYILIRNIPLLASGKHIKWLEILSREADKNSRDRWAPSSWKDLEEKRGKRITAAVKQGCITAWRKFAPLLPHEKPNANETLSAVLVGLTGLQVEFGETHAALQKLTKAEASLATRYALNELNGFPTWLEALSLLHPEDVARVIFECIDAEWQFPAERANTHEILAKLAWRGGGLNYNLKEKLLSLLSNGDPPNLGILRCAISLLMHHPNPPLSELAEFASLRSFSSNPVAAALWLSVLMHIDGAKGITLLESWVKNSNNACDMVIYLSSILSGYEMLAGPFSESPSYFQLNYLRRLIPIIFEYVNIDDDLDRGGEAYTPSARDHAEQFRSTLLSRLENDENFEASNILRELADKPVMAGVRFWITNMLNQRLRKEADFTPWSSSDVHDFAEHHEIDPRNDKELFAIARKRLQVLKLDVEQSENSARDELRKGDREIILRRWLQRRLLERSQKRYSMAQEAEIDLQERPDLRLENSRTGPVSIEVKWADRWTLSELLERLENQLVGQYLRAHNSQYGIYFLGMIGNKQNWEDPKTGKFLNFDQVVCIIRDYANVLMEKNRKIAGLEVVSINFCQPKTQLQA